jgi:hypothetical protein
MTMTSIGLGGMSARMTAPLFVSDAALFKLLGIGEKKARARHP